MRAAARSMARASAARSTLWSRISSRGRTGDTRPPSAEELAITSVIEFPLVEVSAKTRSGPPVDSKADHLLPFWGGVMPLRLVADAPVSDDAAVRARISPPQYLEWETRR